MIYKYLFVLLIGIVACTHKAPIVLQKTIVEASCGQCKFKMKGHGCDLAIRKDGITYFVDGTSIDDHGDAHASDGFCAAIRKAEVSGKVVNGRFVATEFRLVKE